MPRKLRVQYPGAVYHVMNRGDRREAIFSEERIGNGCWTPSGETCESWQRFHVPQCSRDDLGSLYTPAVLVFAPGDYGDPEPDCVPFGPSLISLFGLLGITMLTSVHLV